MHEAAMQLSGWSLQGRRRAANGDAWAAFVPPERERVVHQGALLAIAEGYGADGKELPWLGGQVLQALGRRYYAGRGDRAAGLLAAAQEANRLVLGCRRQPGWGGVFAGLIAAVATPEDAVLAQVGDGQAFLLRGRQVSPLFPWSQRAAAREPWQRPVRRVLDTALGGQMSVPVRLNRFALQAGDQLLLCSGGFRSGLPSWPGWAALPDPADMARAADDGNGHLNRTVVTLRMPLADPPRPALVPRTLPPPRPGQPDDAVDWQAVAEVLGPVVLAIGLTALGMTLMSR